jgi:thiamine-monophosphate kinase
MYAWTTMLVPPRSWLAWSDERYRVALPLATAACSPAVGGSPTVHAATGMAASTPMGTVERQTVGELGEVGLIAALTARLAGGADVALGPGDDAALVRTTDDLVVATTDVLVEGVHFRRDWSEAVDVGHKAAAQNLADIAAMGARGTALLVGLASPADVPVSWVMGLADGLSAEAALVGAAVVGGDVVASDQLVIAVTALGALDGRAAVRRSGAKVGDIVAVSGRLGWSAGGLAVLSRGFRSPRTLAAAHRRPAPPYASGPAAAVAGATAMVDISDGLMSDLAQVAEASKVAIELEVSALVIGEPLRDAAAALGRDPLEWVLAGGEDHALAATFPADVVLPDGFVRIGRVVLGAGVSVAGLPAGTYQGPGGWRHYSVGRPGQG